MASDPARNVLRRRSLSRHRRHRALPSREITLEARFGWPRVLSYAGRLSVGALGLSLALIVSVAWGTALFYLAARLGAGSGLRLAWIDAVHVYVGLVGGVFVVAKVARVRFRYRVAGVPEVVRWQRWLSWSMLGLYSCVFASGVLLLFPIPGRLYGDLVNFHLLTSFWALVPTTWHVWHYRRRALPFLTRILPRGRTGVYWVGVGLALLPSLVVVANARSLSQLPRVLGGARWTPYALQGSYLDRITVGPHGTLIAAGDAVYISGDGTVWTQIDLPAAEVPSNVGAPAVHQHGAPSGNNLALSVAVSGETTFVGAGAGLYSSSSQTGPFVPLAFAGSRVDAVVGDPANPRSLWAGTSTGLMHSLDAGQSWSAATTGLAKANAVTTLAF
jgi:hypothetical protein